MAAGRDTDTRDTLANVLEQETATTLKVLKAYPKDQAELRPHERSKNALELAWLFAMEQQLGSLAVQDQLDMSSGFPSPPDSFDEVIAAFEEGRASLVKLLREGPDDLLDGTVHFFTGPKQMGDIPKAQFLWFLLHDQIHHRGQFSVYLRMAGGKVPSIYGPSADEPWM
jgi:uncharacterized damage-inducible protein DinB